MPTTLQNFYKQTLLLACTDSATTIYVTTKPTTSAGWLVISPNNSTLREIIQFTATGTDGTGDFVTVSARGVGGTTAQSHEAGEPVRMNITAQHWADIYANPTFTGTVTVPTPTNATDAATKGYADGLAIAGAPDAALATKGINKLSVAPVSPTEPIAVGDNDPRVPTTGENDALQGTSGTPSNTNRFATANDESRNYNIVAYAADAGANDTYTITLSPAPTAYTAGMVVKFKANTANTGAATINVNGLGAKTIVKYVNTTLTDGDIAAGMLCTLIYDGTNFVLQNPTISQATSYISALTTVNSTTVQNIDTTITSGFTPRVITIYYYLEGVSAGAANITSGVAVYNSSGTLISNNSLFSSKGAGINVTTSFPTFDNSAPTAGLANSTHIILNLSVSSVSSTGLVVRTAYTAQSGNPNGSAKFVVVVQS